MITEAQLEDSLLDWLGDLGWEPGTGAELESQRATLGDLVLTGDFVETLRLLNPSVPDQYLREAAADMVRARSQDAPAENRDFHVLLVHGYRGLTYVDTNGREQIPTIRLLGAPEQNRYRAVRQVRLRQGDNSRRLDVVLYVNGLPLVVVELKQAGTRNATIAKAHAQLGAYLAEFPAAFRPVVATVVSDGINARYGTPFTRLNHYSPWNVDEDGAPRPADGEQLLELENLAHGLLEPARLLDMVRNFTAFDETDEGLIKRIAKPHQYFAVRKAIDSTLAALGSNGKAGVVWHTQGSGKSMEMELYANLVLTHPRMHNPTIVVITDRNELDGQLYDTFARSTLLPDQPRQIKRRSELRSELSGRVSGGIYFTTLQKFGRTASEQDAGHAHPLLTDRRNVIVIVDEAHRSHYDDLDGYARHLRDALPNATLIAFTGTPINETDRNTREVFGDYVDIYDLSRAVTDGATVPVYFEPRLIEVRLDDDMSAEKLDELADEQTSGLDDEARERVERSVAELNAIYGAPERIDALARDIVEQWERRRGAMTEFLAPTGPDENPDPHGKALVVCATREICARLYARIVELRPGWHCDQDDRGLVKVVYSGSPSDPEPIRDHVRRDSQNKAIKNRLRDVDDELELVIVKDMLLTGFDAPPLHTLFLDRPLKGALLMQTLARVNRTFRGKRDGLLVAYAPLTENLNKALREYTATDQATRPVGRDSDEAVRVTVELVEALRVLLAGHDWRTTATSGARDAGLRAVGETVEYLRSPATPGNQAEQEGQTLGERFRALSGRLARMWALAGGAEKLSEIATEVRFYEEVRVWMAKLDARQREASGQPVPEEIVRVLRGAVAQATAAGDITDLYEAAGLPRPSLQELDTQTLDQMQQAPNRHLAVEALRDLLVKEAEAVTRNNVVRRKTFSERISELMIRYTNQQITAADVIYELGRIAEEVRGEADRGTSFDPPLSHDELAFYDAVSQNDSAVLAQGTDVLAQIARELVTVMRRDTRTDWTRRPEVQAKLRASVKRLLRRYHYPPDKQKGAVELVIEQMETLAPNYARGEDLL
ncbi:Type III restriction enzyme, res subunit [Propionibacterium ruminifibrarum]|uniref:Type I restriction enzyme endonuclease subunit n=1 Tax=Propionibacterium ruminifibrarum TaxID=1962131 RepID=A0A375I5D0_9ACTN|nr:type I restriction endonuclease subunit R [Propionibacterium ruminifibrarum]SPF69400.1 Type III restriction enzyme, res subunit [Propionibacterium ruminifibrarum]